MINLHRMVEESPTLQQFLVFHQSIQVVFKIPYSTTEYQKKYGRQNLSLAAVQFFASSQRDVTIVYGVTSHSPLDF